MTSKKYIINMKGSDLAMMIQPSKEIIELFQQLDNTNDPQKKAEIEAKIR